MTVASSRALRALRACAMALAATSLFAPALAADRWLSVDKAQGVGVYVWDNGMRYEGGHLAGKRQGRGVQIWPNGDRFEGEFEDNRMLRGRWAYASGHVYEGSLDARGQRAGAGSYTWPSGQKYEGQWVDGKYQGAGRLRTADGAVFDGVYAAGDALRGVRTTGDGKRVDVDMAAVVEKRTGLVITVDASGNRYEGSFVEGRRQGRGKLIGANGSSFEGEFAADQMQRGLQRIGNGETYEGSFNAKGQREGQGSYTWPDGTRYEGGWLEGLYHGEGRMKTGDAVFAGSYVAGKAVKGTRVQADGKRIEADLDAVTAKKTGSFVTVDLAGNRYEGAFVDGKRQGRGVLAYADGGRAEGEFANDQFVAGKRQYSNGQSYEGGFDAQGRRSGQGAYSWPSRHRYEGGFVEGQFHGPGRMQDPDGSVFEGEYVADRAAKGRRTQPDGKVIEVDMSFAALRQTGTGVTVGTDGARYEGEFVDGKRQGRGTRVLVSGTREEGDWTDDRLLRGRVVYASGQTYEGGFDEKGRRSGRGVYTFPGGQRYEGEFLAGEYSGRGVLVLANGARFEGDFLRDKRNGRGVAVEADGTRYEGDFVDGLREGQGVELTAQGGRYEGGFLRGKRSGLGKFVGPKHSYEGGWLDGRMSGRGTYRYADGSFYEGEMANGNFNGYGVHVYADGDRYAGQWVDDKRQGQTQQEASSSGGSGQLIAGLIGSAVIGSARGIPGADKVRLISGFVQDVATDGRAGGIQSAMNDIGAARAQSAAVQQAIAEQQRRAAEQAQARALAEQERQQAQLQARLQGQRQAQAQAQAQRQTTQGVQVSQLARTESASPQAAQQATQQATQQKADQERRERERQEQEAARKREEDKRAAADARARQVEELAARRAREKADKETAERARAQAEAQAKSDFLDQMRRGTQLRARKCPDGEGKYYVVGLFPKVSPKPMSCLDVHFKAVCPGSVVGSAGVGKNFSGIATDCFMGDAVKIEPTPACKVEEVSVQVTDVRGCGE